MRNSTFQTFLMIWAILIIWTSFVVWVIVPATTSPMSVLVASGCPHAKDGIRISSTFEEDHDWSAGCKNIERHAL